MADKTIKKCIGTCYDATGWGRRYPCSRRATVGNYCRLHDPATRREKADARHAEWKAKNDLKWSKEKLRQENQLVGAWVRANGCDLTCLPWTFDTYLTVAKLESNNAHKP